MPYMEMERKLDRDHSNFIHAVKSIENLRECDIETRAIIEGIETEYPWLRKEVA
jgi:chromosomal replication initiation ATPase DnaA